MKAKRNRRKHDFTASPWGGQLTAKECATGVMLCGRNARRLLRDSYDLFDHRSYPSAVALAIHGLEEAAKPALLLDIYLSPSDAKARGRAWDEFRSHDSKGQHAFGKLFLAAGIPPQLAELQVPEPEAFVGGLSDLARERSVYVECIDDQPRWHDPESEIDEDWARAVLTGVFNVICANWTPLDQMLAGRSEFARPSERAVRAAMQRFTRWIEAGVGADLCARERELMLHWLAHMLPRRNALLGAPKSPGSAET